MEYTLSASQIFTLFFIMLGPLKFIGPFHHATEKISPRQLQTISIKIILFSTITLLAGGLIGRILLHSWKIPTPVLMLAGGIVFLIAALTLIMRPHEPDLVLNDSSTPASAKVTFSMVVTAYGMATLIVLLATSQDLQRTMLILSLLIAVMLLNFIFMIFIRNIVKFSAFVTPILGAALGILQVALAILIILAALKPLIHTLTSEASLLSL